MRLAIVSPLPPAASGIADYTVDLVALAAPRHEIELFHAQEVVHASGLPPGLALHAAAELPQRHGERAFDLVVYQMGNGRLHDFLYDLVSRVPGLLVLHDLVLHHARAAQFLEAGTEAGGVLERVGIHHRKTLSGNGAVAPWFRAMQYPILGGGTMNDNRGADESGRVPVYYSRLTIDSPHHR